MQKYYEQWEVLGDGNKFKVIFCSIFFESSSEFRFPCVGFDPLGLFGLIFVDCMSAKANEEGRAWLTKKKL